MIVLSGRDKVATREAWATESCDGHENSVPASQHGRGSVCIVRGNKECLPGPMAPAPIKSNDSLPVFHYLRQFLGVEPTD